MKIAFIVTKFPSLSQTFVLNQITGLMDLGHEIDIYASGAGNELEIHEDVEKYNLLERTCYHRKILENMPAEKLSRVIHALKLIFKYIIKRPLSLITSLNIIRYGRDAASLRLLFRIAPFLDKGPYDIIYCHFGLCGNLAVELKNIGAINGKLITVFHGYDLSSYIKQRGDRIYEKLFKNGDLFLPVSFRWAQELLKLGCLKEKICVHRMGINVDKFNFSQHKINKNGKINILTVARLVEKKGVKYAIQAVAKVVKHHPDIEYNIVGDGPLKEDINDLINKLNISKNIKLLGWMRQQDIINQMSFAHIFLAPSVTSKDGDQEGIPVVLMEASAMGLPVITTNHSGISELVQNGISGYTVPERDVNAIVSKLTYLITQPEVRLKMGLAGRKYVEREYNIAKLNDRLQKLFEGLLKFRKNQSGKAKYL